MPRELDLLSTWATAQPMSIGGHIVRVALYQNRVEQTRMFTATCQHSCRRSWGVQIAEHLLVSAADSAIREALQLLFDQVDRHACISMLARAGWAEWITRVLAEHGPMGRDDLYAHLPYGRETLLKVAYELGFQGARGTYRLPIDHPWV